MIKFELSFTGSLADAHELDMYDAAQAMLGFQRSLAITTHLIINGSVITQAPSLKGAKILSTPPEPGSWKIPATISSLAIGVYALGTAPRDTPIGHLMHSAYDYIVSESLGFHVDYEKTLGQQYEELSANRQNQLPVLKQSNFDSAIEKCEAAIKEMHRPIVQSQSASEAEINYCWADDEREPLQTLLTPATFEYINSTVRRDKPVEIRGKISGYNMNTYKGRIFVFDESRALPFELADAARNTAAIRKITDSLSQNATNPRSNDGYLVCKGFERVSRSGKLKGFYIVEIDSSNFADITLEDLGL